MQNTPLFERIARIHELHAEFRRAEDRFDAARRNLGEHPSANADRTALRYAEHALFTLLQEYRVKREAAAGVRVAPIAWTTDRATQEQRTEDAISYFEVYEQFAGRDPKAGLATATAKLRAA